jgi:phosphatidylinositol alpha-mannosyltransferase
MLTIPDFWPHVRRGSERVVHDLAAEMTARGHQVTVVTRGLDQRRTVLQMDGFRVIYGPARNPLGARLGLSDMEGFAFTAAREALVIDADVYHAFYLTDARALSLATRPRRRPFVLSLHGIPNRAWWSENAPRTHGWMLRALRRADAVTVLTEHSAERLREDYGADPGVDPQVLTPGIYVDQYVLPRRPGPPRVVCSAAIDDPRKRIDLLLAAFEEVAAEQPALELVLAGQGDAASVRAQLASMPPASRERVRLEPDADLPGLFAGCTLGALTSHNEAFGLAVVEYLAAGMPAVVSDDSGPADIVTAETGVTFVAGDVGSCAAGLREGLAMAIAPGSAERCRARAAEFSWERRAGDYEALYLRLARP